MGITLPHRHFTLAGIPRKFQRILVPIENLNPRSLWVLRFAQTLAEATQAQVTLLHVATQTAPGHRFSNRAGSAKVTWMRSQLELMASKVSSKSPPLVEVQEDVMRAIVTASRSYDLVVLRSSPRRTSAGSLLISDLTSQVAQRLTCSVIMLGEPNTTTVPSVRSRTLATRLAT